MIPKRSEFLLLVPDDAGGDYFKLISLACFKDGMQGFVLFQLFELRSQ
jgi:hypothetical protein